MSIERTWTRRAFLGGCASAAALSAGCTADGQLSVLGYSTQPNYDTDIRTVYVPIFRNNVFKTTPFRSLEFDLTRAVIREIEFATPFKVVSDPDRADTELLGSVESLTKAVVNVNQVAQVRQFDLYLTVEVVWRDLRTGKALSNRRPPIPVNATVPTFNPADTVVVDPIDLAIPVRIVTMGRGIPELGESSTTAMKMAVDKMAIEIRQMMELPW